MGSSKTRVKPKRSASLTSVGSRGESRANHCSAQAWLEGEQLEERLPGRKITQAPHDG